MTFFVCCYLLLRFVTKEYFVFVKGEKKALEKNKKNYEYEVEDNESTLRQIDNAEKLNKHIKPENNHPYNDLKESYPKQFNDNSTVKEDLTKLRENIEKEIEYTKEIIEQIKGEIANITPTPSSPEEDSSTPVASSTSTVPTVLEDSASENPRKRKTPSDFIDDLPSELPGFMDEGD